MCGTTECVTPMTAMYKSAKEKHINLNLLLQSMNSEDIWDCVSGMTVEGSRSITDANFYASDMSCILDWGFMFLSGVSAG